MSFSEMEDGKRDAIGGYFALECGTNGPYHGGVYVNSARNAFRLIVRKLGVRSVWLPQYDCPVVGDAFRAEGCAVREYGLGGEFLPDREFPVDDFIVYNNYFGVCGEKVAKLAGRYRNLLVDNAQAFFSRKTGRAASYSPRKFFGLPDGGIAVGQGLSGDGLPQDVSADRCRHLLLRHDGGAECGFDEFRRADASLVGAEVRALSPLTAALMGNIDYERARRRRLENFEFLHERLRSTFPFALAVDDVPMVYPLVTDSASVLRDRLRARRIYVATYWPDLAGCERLSETILPLPVDQRYGLGDMRRILEVIGV